MSIVETHSNWLEQTHFHPTITQGLHHWVTMCGIKGDGETSPIVQCAHDPLKVTCDLCKVAELERKRALDFLNKGAGLTLASHTSSSPHQNIAKALPLRRWVLELFGTLGV